ncbi:MAG TPA: glycosyltransferase family 1 protein, partial [Acidimicrobiaceae bacterium]|nr:glycosyltransferase family 1 protein [Acidimicrobiaceae bacterium]
MRIAMVCPYSLSIPGGVQGQVLGLAKALRERGHFVQVVAPSDGPPPDAGVIVVGTSILNASNGSMAPISPDPGAQLRTIRALWDEPFDVLHLHEPLVPGPTVTALLMRTAPIVATFHAAGDQPGYKSMSALARRFASRISAKVAVSPDAMALARSAIPDPWTVLFNGVDVSEFSSATPWVDPPRSGPGADADASPDA